MNMVLIFSFLAVFIFAILSMMYSEKYRWHARRKIVYELFSVRDDLHRWMYKKALPENSATKIFELLVNISIYSSSEFTLKKKNDGPSEREMYKKMLNHFLTVLKFASNDPDFKCLLMRHIHATIEIMEFNSPILSFISRLFRKIKILKSLAMRTFSISNESDTLLNRLKDAMAVKHA